LPAIKRPPAQELERITTGENGLDSVLHGGIPRGSVVFVAGLPGTGKTVLCQQMAWANARVGERVLYLSTLSEPMLKLLHFSQVFSFFRPDFLGNEILYADLGDAMQQQSAEATLEALDRLVQDHRPQLLVIDSFKALRESFGDGIAFRRFASEMMVRLGMWEVTTLLVGEYDEDDVREQPEFAIADGIIYLYGTEEVQKQKRYLRVMKMRGTGFFGGQHLFDIGQDGITLYPRMQPHVTGEYKAPETRLKSQIQGLDQMLGGGIFDSTVTLIAGATGSGKTITALSFLMAAVHQGIPGLLVAMEESRGQLTRNSDAFGWDMEEAIEEGLLNIVHFSPSELDIDRHAVLITEQVIKTGARIVVIDSITSLEVSVGSIEKYHSFLWALNDYFKRLGVTLLLTTEQSVKELGPGDYANRRVSLFSDAIITLRLVNVNGHNKRAISVLKIRGSAHDNSTRELIIEPPNIRVGDVLEAMHREDGARKENI
jgi:circadian clock protein KaiC